MPVLTAHFFTLMYRHFMTFSLFSAGHIVSVFPLVLKADNIESFFKTANLISSLSTKSSIYQPSSWTCSAVNPESRSHVDVLRS